MAFLPDGRPLAFGAGDTIKLWNVAQRGNIATFEDLDGAISVEFSPDGKWLASTLEFTDESGDTSDIQRVFDTMERAERHIYQVLTKRSSRMRRFVQARWIWRILTGSLLERRAGRVDAAFGFGIEHAISLTYIDGQDAQDPGPLIPSCISCLSMFILTPRKAFEFKPRIPEVDQQSDLDASRVQVVDDLGFMLWRQSLHRFEFDHHFVFDKNIRVEIANGLSTKTHSDELLDLKGNSGIG